MKRRLARIGIVVAAIVLAGLSFAQAMGQLVSSSNFRMALAFDHTNADARAAAAMSEVVEDRLGQNTERLAGAISIARKTLAVEPLHVASLRTLAYANSAMGRDKVALTQLEVADRLTRRDLGTQLALIEYCVKAADTACAIRHYASALATSAEAGPILTDRLLAALEDPEIRAALVPSIREGQAWIGNVLLTGSEGTVPSRNLALAMIDAGRVPRGLVFDAVAHNILSRLYADDEYALARRLFLTLPAADPSVLFQTRFTARSTAASREPINWQAVAQDSANATFVDLGAQVILEATAFVSTPTLVARKLLYLQPGSYRVEQKVRAGEGAAATGEWRLYCRRPLSNQPAVMPVRTGISEISIKPCEAQVIELWVEAGTASLASLTVENIALLPIKVEP